mgnify:CR=1 FL=1
MPHHARCASTDSSLHFVTGGTGLIGGEIILALTARGHRVRALVRASSDAHARERLLARLSKSDAFRAESTCLVDAIAGDTTVAGLTASRAPFDRVSTVIHCAANTEFSERAAEQVWATNALGAHHLVTALSDSAPTPRLILVSTASVTTAPEGRCLAEDAPHAGHANAYTESKRAAEATVLASGLDAVIVRPSIVLSRGVRDRAMARSILWAVPIMSELGEVPIEAGAVVDIVPVDFVARALAGLATSGPWPHRIFHVSAGRDSRSFAELQAHVSDALPQYRRIRPTGRSVNGRRTLPRLMRPIEAYLPFINANVCYANDRLIGALGEDGCPPRSVEYLPGLVSQITLNEALAEMARP